MYYTSNSDGLIKCHMCGKYKVDTVGDFVITRDEYNGEIKYRCDKCNKFHEGMRNYNYAMLITPNGVFVNNQLRHM